jgi:hypothetical protein
MRLKWQLHTYKMAAIYLQGKSYLCIGTYILTKWPLRSYKMLATHLQNGSYVVMRVFSLRVKYYEC